jgi:hypothetical protein
MSDDPNPNSDKDPYIQFSAVDLAEWKSTSEQLLVKTDKGDGVDLKHLPAGERLLIITNDKKSYFIERQEAGLYIWGDTKYYPTPVLLIYIKSVDNRGEPKADFIEQGTSMEFSIGSKGSDQGASMAPKIIVTDTVAKIIKSSTEK